MTANILEGDPSKNWLAIGRNLW